MQINDLIPFVFGDADGPFILFDAAEEDIAVQIDWDQDVGAAIAGMATPHLDFVLGDGRVAAVAFAGDDPDASCVISGPAGAVSVFVLDPPAPGAEVPDDVLLAMPLPVGGMEVIRSSDHLMTLAEVLNPPEDVDATDLDDPAAVDTVEPTPEPIGDTLSEEPADAGDDGAFAAAEQGDPLSLDTGSGSVGEYAAGGHAAPADLPAGPEAAGPEGDAAEVVGPEPVYQNDAELLGASTPAMEAVLDRPATYMIGTSKQTADGSWKAVTMPLRGWIEGTPETANNHAFGFSRHPVSKNKDGSCVVFGESLDGARKAKAMVKMEAMALDIDSGATLETVIGRIKKLGLFALLYTSHSHGATELLLKRDEVLRKLKVAGPLTIDNVREYLNVHSKSRYEPDFIAGIEIVEEKVQTTEGVKTRLRTPPMDKFRVIFPLAEPVRIIDLAERQEEALAIWEDKITGLAVDMLGVHFDTSCTDPSRLFYLPRHRKGAEWDSVIVQGEPLSFTTVKRKSKATYARERTLSDNPFAEAGADLPGHHTPQVFAPDSGSSLNDWYATTKGRFQIAYMLESHCDDRIRRAGGEGDGKVHTECPFEDQHSSEGGTACMAVNSDASPHEIWTWTCRHDSCQSRHKLEFVREALAQGWFEESVLTDEDWLLPLPDDEIEMEIAAEEEAAAEVPEAERAVLRPFERAALLDPHASAEDIIKFMQKLLRRDIDIVDQSLVTNVLAERTPLTKPKIEGLWKKAKAEEAKRVKEANPEEAKKPPLVNEESFHTICEYAQQRIDHANEKTPRLFHYMEALSVIREDANGMARIKMLNEAGFAHVLNSVATFERAAGENGRVGVSAPKDVVSHLYSGDHGTYPPLRGLITSPVFSASGTLIVSPGYQEESALYYRPNASLAVPAVSAVPSEEEVLEAKRLLVEEVFADFPLGGLTRTEIVAKMYAGEELPALANLFALALLPFMREMVDGPTPGHLLTKPAPATGASLLTDVLSIISTGEPTPAMAMPTNKDEMSKTLTSVLANGQQIVFFDNINHSVDSGELASAMTAKNYSARILGKTQTVQVEVRSVWIITGNNVTLSWELVRRLVMIDLDSRLTKPEMRSDFRHKDIRGWATENRGTLIWASLTLIQNWIAKGKKPNRDVSMASYENWSAAVGGVLRDAGIKGFIGNRQELKEAASDDDQDDLQTLVWNWWNECGASEVPVTSGERGEACIVQMIEKSELALPIKRTKNADGDLVLNTKSIGQFLAKFRGRMFEVENGQEVSLERSSDRKKRGHVWFLKLGARSIPVAA